MIYLPCPKCNGEIETKVAKRGPRIGTEFFGCTNFPMCKFTSNKIYVIDFVKNEIFKKDLPTLDSESWNDDYLGSLSRKEIKFLSSLHDLPFNDEISKDELVKNLLSLKIFEFFKITENKFCFKYNINSNYFDKFSLPNPGDIEIFKKNISFKIYDDKEVVGGLFKVTKKLITLEFDANYTIKYEKGNAILLILNPKKKFAKAIIVNPTIINSFNHEDYTHSLSIVD